MFGWTDYPFVLLGDEPFMLAPIRQVEILNYNGDKYAEVKVIGEDLQTSIKAGYIYTSPGRLGSVPTIDLTKF